MDSDNVWDGFFIHGLLLDSIRRERPLFLPHADIHHASRFDDALKERNQLYSGCLRPQWNHACNDCAIIVTREDEAGQYNIKQSASD